MAVVYNEPFLPSDHPDAASEADVVGVARAVAAAIESSGFFAVPVAAAPPLGTFLSLLEQAEPDVVFNLVEGFGLRSSGATYLAAVFELLGVPYTGSPVEALSACVSKARTKALLRGHGLPVTPCIVVGPRDPVPVPDWNCPTFVKLDAEDGSLGIDQQSVVGRPDELPAIIERLRRSHGGAVLIEPYLPGPEFNVGVVAWPEPSALPLARVAYLTRPGKWPILTYQAKWAEGSEEDLASVIECPAQIDLDLAENLKGLAIAAFRASGCRDYARIDFRLDRDGKPMILEINPNPDIGPKAGIARAMRVAGIPYESAIAAIVNQALERGPPDGRSGCGNHPGPLPAR